MVFGHKNMMIMGMGFLDFKNFRLRRQHQQQSQQQNQQQTQQQNQQLTQQQNQQPKQQQNLIEFGLLSKYMESVSRF